LAGNPIKLSETHEERFDSPPLLGQHNQEVFGELLGLDPKRMEELQQEGAI